MIYGANSPYKVHQNSSYEAAKDYEMRMAALGYGQSRINQANAKFKATIARFHHLFNDSMRPFKMGKHSAGQVKKSKPRIKNKKTHRV